MLEELWVNFIKKLNEVEPIKGNHRVFYGDIEKYKKVFIQANQENHHGIPSILQDSQGADVRRFSDDV